jgi:hypothetical protein
MEEITILAKTRADCEITQAPERSSPSTPFMRGLRVYAHRVLCDTNVLVSALIADGPPSRLLEEIVDGQVDLCLP